MSGTRLQCETLCMDESSLMLDCRTDTKDWVACEVLNLVFYLHIQRSLLVVYMSATITHLWKSEANHTQVLV